MWYVIPWGQFSTLHESNLGLKRPCSLNTHDPNLYCQVKSLQVRTCTKNCNVWTIHVACIMKSQCKQSIINWQYLPSHFKTKNIEGICTENKKFAHIGVIVSSVRYQSM